MDSAMSMASDLARHLPSLLEGAGVQFIRLETLTKRPSFKGGDVSPRAQKITGPAREEHQRRNFGFWEYVLSAAIDADKDTRSALIDGALRHHNNAVDQWVSLDEFTRSLRGGRYVELPPRTIVSITSSVRLDAAESFRSHLPMLDMGVSVGPNGVNACLDALRALELSGLLFDSGRSYHFYADRVISEIEFQRVLTRAQLLSPIIDARWAAHQLLDGQAALRVSTDQTRHQHGHVLVAEV